ncbi:MAG: beta-propeller repeat-containing protein [Acidimicrobiaceae bacterium]|nr:beta-propeller repeat-containing protein [Acidimicrobiaceae bacterium]
MLVRRWAVVIGVLILLGFTLQAAFGGGSPTPAAPPAKSATTISVVPEHLSATLAGWRLGAPVSRTVVVNDGAKLLVLGGLATGDTSTSAIWRVDPLSGSATQVGTLSTPVHDSAGAFLGGRALVFGGGAATTQAIVQAWTGAAAGTTTVGSLPVGRSDQVAAVVGTRAYVLGGFDGTHLVSDIVSTTNGVQYQRAGALIQPVRYGAAATFGGDVWVIGGDLGTSESAASGGQTNDIQRFDPRTGVTKVVGHLPVTLGHASAFALNGQLFVLGGRTGTTLSNRIWRIDTKTGAAIPAGTLAEARSDAAVAVVGGRAWLLGGETGGPLAPLNSVVALHLVPAKRHTVAAVVSAAGRHGNIYAADGPNMLSPTVRNMPYRIYVPESGASDVDVIDPYTYKVVARYETGLDPQHVVPAWNLKTLYAANDLGNSLTPISPYTGKRAGPNVPVADPYNMYFTPNGKYAIVVEEANQILAFRNPRTFHLVKEVHVNCPGVDHGDFSANGSYAIFSCEFSSKMVKVNMATKSVVGYLTIPGSAPQDVKLDPTGRTFYTADMNHGGVYTISAASFKVTGFIPTGRDAHGLYVSRNARYLYVSNRGAGSVSVISFATGRVKTTWHIPGGGSPDMGNISPDGKVLWLSGRYNACVYAISTTTGRLLAEIPVPNMPHGLAVWPQPGQHSLGHTGIMR